MKKLEAGGDIKIAGKTIVAWNKGWVSIPGGFRIPHPKLRQKMGLYRAVEGGHIRVVGSGVNKGGGLAKRLGDFRTPSGYARGHKAGEFIHANLDRLELQILVTGTGAEARRTAEKLVGPMIELLKPSESVPPQLRSY